MRHLIAAIAFFAFTSLAHASPHLGEMCTSQGNLTSTGSHTGSFLAIGTTVSMDNLGQWYKSSGYIYNDTGHTMWISSWLAVSASNSGNSVGLDQASYAFLCLHGGAYCSDVRSQTYVGSQIYSTTELQGVDIPAYDWMYVDLYILMPGSGYASVPVFNTQVTAALSW